MPARQRAVAMAMRIASNMSADFVSVQSVMVAPASRSALIGAAAPKLALPMGACVTTPPAAPKRAMSLSDMKMQCAAIRSGESSPRSSRNSVGVMPSRARS